MSEVYAQEQSFADDYDMENPVNAVSAYSRIMHEHTKRQLQLASKNADRRSSLSSPTSLTSDSSMDSEAGESPA